MSYKGFNSDLTCQNFKYEVGGEYDMDGEIIPYSNGFHACENPFDVFDYYDNIRNNRYCEVEQSGVLVKEKNKTASSHIKIKAEIGFVGLFKAGIEWLKDTPEAINDCDGDDAKICSSGSNVKISSSGNYTQIGSNGNFVCIGSSGDDTQIGSSGEFAKIGSSGDYTQIGSSGGYAKIGSSGDNAHIGSSGIFAQIGSSGCSAKISSSGEFAQIESIGEDAVICCAGNQSKAKAKKGSWITLSEWEYDEEKKHPVPKCVKAEYVDGERIKEDTWYTLTDGEFVEVKC